MKINGKDLSTFNARMVRREVSHAEHIITSEWPVAALIPYINPRIDYRYKDLLLGIEYKGTPAQIEANKSAFFKEAGICSITEIGLGTNIFKGYLDDASIKTIVNGYQEVDYSFKVLEYKSEVQVSISNVASGNVNNTGTGIAPTRIEFTPSASGNYILKINANTDFEIVIEINNATVNTMRSIDVESGIWEGTNNRFSNTKLMDFPFLIPGNNTISISPATATAKFIFTPRMV